MATQAELVARVLRELNVVLIAAPSATSGTIAEADLNALVLRELNIIARSDAVSTTATATQADLVARVLQRLNILVAGETPTAEDDALVDDAIEHVQAELKQKLLCYWQLSAIPDQVMHGLIMMVCGTCGPSFVPAMTVADAEQMRMGGLALIRETVASQPTVIVTQAIAQAQSELQQLQVIDWALSVIPTRVVRGLTLFVAGNCGRKLVPSMSFAECEDMREAGLAIIRRAVGKQPDTIATEATVEVHAELQERQLAYWELSAIPDAVMRGLTLMVSGNCGRKLVPQMTVQECESMREAGMRRIREVIAMQADQQPVPQNYF